MTLPVRAEFVEGLQPLATRYDVVFCDVWGVLHDGVSAYEAAGDALLRFRAGGGHVVLVSNAPRPDASVAAQLDGFGVPRSAYDAIVTSGDLTRLAIEQRRRQIVHHIGPERDLPMFAGIDIRFGPPETAEYVVCSGFEHDETETAADYLLRLGVMACRDLLMICANPDLLVERGHKIIPCAGALGLAFEEMGGRVYYAGKPHIPIYERSLDKAAEIAGRPIPKSRVLAIGDAIRTDIAGAAAFGIDSLLIARGIHAKELNLHRGALVSEHVQDWLDRQPAQPQAVATTLSWAAAVA